MNTFSALLNWYNLPFLSALCGCVGLALLQLLGGFGEQDADADADVDMEVDLNADMDADVAGAEGGSAQGPLAAVGVGRIPLSLVLLAFLLSFGAVGLIGNTLVSSSFGTYPTWAFIPMLIITTILGLLLTGRISGMIAAIAPNTSTAIGFEQLVGRTGIVVSHSLSQTYGRVQVRDSHGSLHTVYAVLAEGEPLPDQTEVALVAYDAAQRRFIVKVFQ
jgi:membrane protein implicated in regulation of membrane protease activity